MQQNRDASSIDRRKMDLMEPGLSDLKDSSSMSQDADVVVQIFYPFREKLSTYRDYNILGDNGFKSNFRSLIISKNRYGLANQVLGCAFYGATG
jgi:replicative DNA helicase